MNGFRLAGLLAATASLAAGVVLAPAAFGLSGYKQGPYSGKTAEQGQEIRFRAGEWRVKRLNTVLNAECKNGSRQKIDVTDGATEIKDDRFALELTGPSELAVRVTGKLQGSEATGRIEASKRPAGTVCTANLRWRAQRG